MKGINEGFDIGFRGPRENTYTGNLKSAFEHPDVIADYVKKETQEGRIGGPFTVPPCEGFRCSPIGAVQKSDPSKFRIIMNLSAPKGNSINDYIPKEDFSLSYITVDDAVNHILEVGKGAILSKVDVEAAFRCVPIKPSQWNLTGFEWDGLYYYDKVLSMGGRSSPYIFNAIAEAAEYICKFNYRVSRLIHLLDDFLAIDKPDEESKSLERILQAFKDLGIPVNPNKVFGPCTCLEFLGIVLDTILMEARLSKEKVEDLKEKLQDFQGKKKVTQLEILSLVGSLSFACKVITPGRSFLSRLIAKAYSVQELHHLVRTSKDLREDCRIWLKFLEDWNGRSLFLSRPPLRYDETIVTDAAGSLGFGGYLVSPTGIAAWFSQAWSPQQKREWHIGPKELYPILVAAQNWGSLWAGKRILVACDNATVVSAINKGYSKQVVLGRMLRALTFYSLKFNFHMQAQHVPGKSNVIADQLSRLQVERFLRENPDCNSRRVNTEKTTDPLTDCSLV